MKNAVKCDKQCELQYRESSDFRTQHAPRVNNSRQVLFSAPNYPKTKCNRIFQKFPCKIWGQNYFLSEHDWSSSIDWWCRARALKLRPGVSVFKDNKRLKWEPDNPLNLSISVSGGKEINRDSLSSGERTGKSPSWESLAFGQGVVSWSCRTAGWSAG